MRGNEKVVEKPNALLPDELTASNNYIVHPEMCANRGMSICTTRPKNGPSTR